MALPSCYTTYCHYTIAAPRQEPHAESMPSRQASKHSHAASVPYNMDRYSPMRHRNMVRYSPMRYRNMVHYSPMRYRNMVCYSLTQYRNMVRYSPMRHSNMVRYSFTPPAQALTESQGTGAGWGRAGLVGLVPMGSDR